MKSLALFDQNLSNSEMLFNLIIAEY